MCPAPFFAAGARQVHSLTCCPPPPSIHCRKTSRVRGAFCAAGARAHSLTRCPPPGAPTAKQHPHKNKKKHGLTKLSLAQSRSRCMRNDLPTRDAGPGSPELCKSGGMPTLGSLLGLNPNILSYQGMLRARGFKLGTDRVWGWRMLAYAWNIKRCPRTNHDS